MIGKACEAFVTAAISKPGAESADDRYSWVQFVASIIAFIIVMLLVTLFGQFLWNNSVVPLVSFARPATSMWQILGLFLITGLLFRA